jgi:hypothetical protein
MPLLVRFSVRWATDGLGTDSGKTSLSREARKAFRMSGGNTIRGNEMSSSKDCAYQFLTLLMDAMELRL